jgi:hypothetical protein
MPSNARSLAKSNEQLRQAIESDCNPPQRPMSRTDAVPFPTADRIDVHADLRGEPCSRAVSRLAQAADADAELP